MDNSHKLGLYVSYYLARFDKLAYENLGLGNQATTHAKIGSLLNINPHTIKNWRDEFDPLYGHRVGWYQRPMTPSRVNVVEALNDLNEEDVRGIVLDILNNQQGKEEKEKLLSIIQSDKNKENKKIFILRSPTGKKAEEYFIEHHKNNQLPVQGNLIDTRDLGVGYDFKINSGGKEYYFEIKGMSEMEGGILFTGKEWETAKSKRDNYFLIVVSGLNNTPKVSFIQNPAGRLLPKRNIVRPIQISWTVTKSDLINVITK